MYEARPIYDTKNRKEAVSLYREWANKWSFISPKAVRCVEKDLEELLNIFYYCAEEI